MIQTISCKTCGKTFAACTEPECYIDDEWIADMKNYAKQGHVVKMVEPGTWSLEGCDCEKHIYHDKADQLPDAGKVIKEDSK